MTVYFGFYNSSGGDRAYDARDISRIFDGMIVDGVFATVGNNLMVVENADMNIGVDGVALHAVELAQFLFKQFVVNHLRQSQRADHHQIRSILQTL